MWPFTKQDKSINEVAELSFNYTPSISSFLKEQFKGEVETKPIKFPTELGEEHPFDFKITEDLYRKFGFFTAVVDKYVDLIVGPGFYIECEDERAKEIIDIFMKDVNFDTKLRAWTKEALVKGNGFMEIGGSVKERVKGLKILNANYMYVNRDKKGNVLGYSQYKGAFDKFAKEKTIPFTTSQIAHVPFNVIGDCAYGLGIGYPALQIINNLLQDDKDLHQMQERKANSPLHAKLGRVDGNMKIIPKAADVTAFGEKMTSMNNKTNWATDDLVNLSVVDFGNIGEKFSVVLEHDVEMLIYAFQIPPELMGKANIPEGMAKVRLDVFERRIQSIQAELEKIIEENIFKRVLNANGFDVDVEFQWGRPSNQQKQERMDRLVEFMKVPGISQTLVKMMEKDVVRLLDYDEEEYEMMSEEEEKERELERSQPLVPGQNTNAPQLPPKEKVPQPKSIKPEEKVKKKIISNSSRKENYEYQKACPHCIEKFEDINDIEEWVGFNYRKFLGQIENAINNYEFNEIKAVNEIELQAGYLTEEQIGKLKGILDEGFKKGYTLKEFEKKIGKLGLKDLYRMTDDGTIKLGVSGMPILARSSDKRPMSIARSEVTRMSTLGAIAYYKENNITQVRWCASYGDRTCPDCEALNNMIFPINEVPEIPFHPLCRCALAPVSEVK